MPDSTCASETECTANLVKIKFYEDKLKEIRDIARVSEGVEFYAMLAEKALDGPD